MKVIFATTNNRKLEDLQNVIKKQGLDIEVLSLNDIGWDLGEIDELGLTIESNSYIKAKAVYLFCKNNKINYPIITDDAGLFVEALNGQPGVYTARYADEEIAQNPELPKHYCVYKLLENMQYQSNKTAEYRAAVTIMFEDGTFKQFIEKTKGLIDDKINEPIKKPYFYSVFLDLKTGKPFNSLTVEELEGTYRYKALKKGLSYLSEENDKTRNKFLN